MGADRPHRKKLPWIAFILGTYKIIVFLLGLNMVSIINQAQFSGGTYLIRLLLGPLLILDQVLTYIGPFLFFWGLTKLLIQNSLKFQQLTSKVYRITGDLGALASKNVRRNPARSAAVAFVIALIIGYGVQVTGQLASEQDYIDRQVLFKVGADLTVSVINATEAQTVLEDILGNVSQIQYSTIERTVRQNSAGTVIRTVEPDSWTDVAYLEDEWFSGNSFEKALDEMRANNMTIILERRIAKQYNMSLYDEIGIEFMSGGRKLKIVGFFGPEPTEAQASIMNPYSGYVKPMWSYAPKDLFNMSSPFSDAYMAESFETKILFKLNDGANGTEVAEAIRDLGLEIYGVQSFDEELRLSQAQQTQYTYYESLVMDVQQLGVFFVVISASVGVALISIISMRERSREATIMSVKGLSYRQLVWMFLSENLAVIVFSVVLGLVVGLIIVYGNVSSSNVYVTELVKQRVVFTNEFLNAIGFYVSLIFASAILPIIVMSRQYVTKLERMIRLR
jgi:ABC-type lipoprotein release transport system permease subunit